MQKKNRVIIGSIAAVLIACPFMLHSKSKPPAVETSTCCKKVTEDCPEKGKNTTGEMLPESLSRQFIFITAPVY